MLLVTYKCSADDQTACKLAFAAHPCTPDPALASPCTENGTLESVCNIAIWLRKPSWSNNVAGGGIPEVAVPSGCTAACKCITGVHASQHLASQ